MMRNEDLIKRALDAVNHVRLTNALGPPLESMPKGVRLRAEECPIARCLPDADVSASVIHAPWAPEHVDWHAHGYYMDTPWPIKEFIEAFDAGELPELIEP